MKKSRIVLVLIFLYGIFVNIVPIVWENYPINPNSSMLGNFMSIIVYMFLFMLGIFYKLEESALSTKEIVIIAIYSTFVGVSRVPFAAFPSINPCSFLIFCAGWVFGPIVGFTVGSITVLISNMFLGQGPWTLYQIFGWGLMGLLGGLLNHKGNKPSNKWLNISIGFIFGFLYGWLLNLWYFLLYVPDHTWKGFFLANATSLPFDTAHAIANVVFFYFFGDKTINILYRYRHRFLFTLNEKTEEDLLQVNKKAIRI